MPLSEIEIINKLNSELTKIQSNINVGYQNASLPMTFIVGCPRSGTTALLQYLANTSTWSYPTNLLTRFSGSIYIGALVQELLFSHDFGLIKQEKSIDFKSDYGRSQGALNANEFFHFFRRFFPSNEIKHLSDEQLALVDTQKLAKEIATFGELTRKPFLSKGLMLQYNLEYFYRKLPQSIFVYIKRDSQFVMQSIYNARIREFGDVKRWWSAKPAEYCFLKDRAPEEQIAGQVFFTNRAIESGLESIPTLNKLEVRYEDFVSNPRRIYSDLIKKYQKLGCDIQENEVADERELYNSNSSVLNQEVFDKMNDFLTSFEKASSYA